MAKTKPKTDDNTKESTDDTTPPPGHNPRRTSQQDDILAKRRAALEAEASGKPEEPAAEDPPASGDEGAESQDEGQGNDDQQEKQSAAEADKVPEFEGQHVVVQEGKEYFRAGDGTLIPVEDGIRGYQQMGDSTRRYQQAATLEQQARQHYERAERVQEAAKRPKLTKEQAESATQELVDLRNQAWDARVDGDESKAEELEKQYSAKLTDLIFSAQSAPDMDQQAISDIVTREIAKREENREQQALGAAYTWYEQNHPDIASDPRWNGLMGGELEALRNDHQDWGPQQLFEEAVKNVQKVKNGNVGANGKQSQRQKAKESAASGAGGTGAGRAAAVDNSDPALTGGNKITEAELQSRRREVMEKAAKDRNVAIQGGVAIRGADQ